MLKIFLAGKTHEEQLKLVAIDLKTSKTSFLLSLPEQQEVQMSLSPDGLILLFDTAIAKEALPQRSDLTTEAIQ
ncbi:MAG: hypothetical protein NVS2B14_13260 [Chamaesiphon sp.]